MLPNQLKLQVDKFLGNEIPEELQGLLEAIAADYRKHEQQSENMRLVTYIMLHDLRSPVANIKGLLDIMKSDQLDKVTRERCIEGIASSSKRLDEVIRDLNDIIQARDLVGLKEKIQLSDIITSIRTSKRNIIETEGVSFQEDYSGFESITSVKGYLYSIFFNIISNSIKYRSDKSPVISILSVKDGNCKKIIIRDNGIGIDMNKYSGEVFGLYKRFHSHREGKGMGLFLVRQQMESLGGNVLISSEVGKGTEIILEFPE